MFTRNRFADTTLRKRNYSTLDLETTTLSLAMRCLIVLRTKCRFFAMAMIWSLTSLLHPLPTCPPPITQLHWLQKCLEAALTGVTQWVGCCPANKSHWFNSPPGQPGLGSGWGCWRGNQSVFLSRSFSPLSKNKQTTSLKKCLETSPIFCMTDPFFLVRPN